MNVHAIEDTANADDTSVPALEVRDLERAIEDFQLGPLNMTVPQGAIYGFIGPNGAGKTTTINLIMGMGREDRGTVRGFGLDHIRDEVAFKANVGYVSPELDFTPWSKVKRLMRFLRQFYADWDDAYCRDLLTRFNIGWEDSIASLSFGSRTKLTLVAALSHHPRLLLLDEPQSGLDAVAKRQLFTELLDAVQDEQRAILIASHNLDEIERFADHLGIIHNGCMLVEGSTDALLERFRMADCTLPPDADLAAASGVTCLERAGGRVRLLIDLSANALMRLQSLGATDIAQTRLSLEDLFVGLVEGFRPS